MNCSNCGSPLQPGVKFCSHCGTGTRVAVEPETETERTETERTEPERHYYERKPTYEEPPVRYDERYVHPAPVNDQGGCGISLLSFIIPIVGLILWIVWSSEKPKSARAARNGFLAALVVWIILFVLWFVFVFMLATKAIS